MTSYLEAINRIATAVLAECLNTFPVTVGIVLAVGAVGRLVRGLNASTRHAMWWAALLALLSVAPLRVTFSHHPGAPDATSNAVSAAGPAAHEAPVPVIIDAVFEPAPPAERPHSFDPGWVPLVLALALSLWFAVQVVRIVYSYFYLRQLKATGIRPSPELRVSFDEWVIGSRIGRPVRLLLSDRIASPVAAGFRNPAVLIPRTLVERLNSADLDHMLLHELAHLARRDDWTNLAVRLAWSLFGFHPAAAYVLKRIDEERELACDDWVVQTTGAARPYAVSLSRLVEFRLRQAREMLATGIGGRNSRLADRIERLLQASCQFDSRLSIARISMTMTVLVTAVAAGLSLPAWIVLAQSESRTATPEIVQPLPPVEPQAPPDAMEAQAPAAPPSPRTPRPAPVPTPSAGAIGAERAAPPSPPAPSAGDPVFAPVQPPPPPPPPQERPSFLKALSDAGYSDLPVDAIIELKNNGVSPSFLAAANQAGWGRLSISQLVELRHSGVSTEFLKAARDSGIRSLTFKDVIALRNQGVRMEGVREIHSLGFGPYAPEQIVELWKAGVRPDYFRSLKESGLANLDAKQIIEAQRHGVSGSDLLEARKYGTNLSIQQIIRLKQAGVI